MMIPAELQFFFENLINKKINLEHIPMEPLLFVCGEARAESNRRCVERQSGAALLFIRGATRVKSISFC
jgi:hypothetical protein